MAKENKYSTNIVPDYDTDWDSIDPSNGLEWSGESVQKFIKSELNKKTSDTYFDPETNTLYAFKNVEDKDAWLEGGGDSYVLSTTPFNFSGTINQIKIISDVGTNVNFTTAQEKAELTVTFLSQEKGITDTSWTEVFEDFLVTVAIDKGATGSYVPMGDEVQVNHGQSFTVDVKKYLATGSNRVRITAKGVTTNATANLIYNVNVTTMYLRPANFEWNVPFIENEIYQLGSVYIGGNIDKVLNIKISDDIGYSKTYQVHMASNVTYINIPYMYKNLEFPTNGTGVYNVEMWLDANGLESDHLHYNIICVSQNDRATAKLVAIANTPKEVKNYSTNNLFSYVVYNGGSTLSDPKIEVKSIVNNITNVLISETLGNVPTGTINEYIVDIEIDSAESNLTLSASIEFGNEQEAHYTVDNSASFPAMPNAYFYMNPANRSNAQANRELIINESNVGGAPSTYTATWTNVAFVDGRDGWTVDDEGRKCLMLPATSKVELDYKPMSGMTTRSIEFAYKILNASDYDEDIITVASSMASDFVGFKIKPNKIILHSNLLRTSDSTQSYNLKDEEFVHILITIVRSYKNVGNLAQIYVNGVKKCSFEWSGGDTFANEAKLVIGSQSSDMYIYKIRVYDSPFEWVAVSQNFISCLPDTASKQAAFDKMNSAVVDYALDFDTIVKNKLNYFVVELPNNQNIPSKLNDVKVDGSILTVNIFTDPDATINGVYEDVTTEGQGTTAMTYFRWNLRWKTDTIRITAKKNVASSMHSHKMGATSLYNDLNMAIVGPNETGCRVAVYQHPAYGFQKRLKEGTTTEYTYEPIGLYTIGPDKGDKPTFGFNHSSYKKILIHMEGADHTPQGVGMDYPWNQLAVKPNPEGDMFLGARKSDGTVTYAWEIGTCGPAETEDEMWEYLEQEFKPAYECDYKNTCMLVGFASGTNINDINSNINEFRSTTAWNGFTYADCLIWIDGEYDTYYYSVYENKYVKDGLNLLSDLGISASSLKGSTVLDKNNEIIELRKARYRANMGNYWHLRDNLFHYCFIMLLGATDNYKKNTYPYKFDTLANGSRWRWRQDDLDTLFDINNLGIADKPYSVMNGDTSGNAQYFKGNSSYHWRNIQEYYKEEIKDMMNEILTKMAELCPSGYGTSSIEKVIGCIRSYFWDKAQDYFPISAYNIDAEWTYEDAWAVYKVTPSVNAVHPLNQSLGSHYEAERAWVELRIIYMASMYGFGAFNDYKDITLGQLNFRPSGDNIFNIVPAIDMNPTIVSGQGNIVSYGDRVMAGDVATINMASSASANTIICVQATDYIQDLGDLKTIQVNDELPDFRISGKRLQRIKVGDVNAGSVTTNISKLDVGACPSVAVVDARNATKLSGTVDLSQCPRLREALFGGSNVNEIVLPSGSKLEKFDLPDSITNLSLVNVSLDLDGLTYNNLSSLTYLRVENNPNINGYELLKAAFDAGSLLTNIRIVGFTYDGNSSDVDLLASLGSGNYHGIDADGSVNNSVLPTLEGTINIDGSVYQDAAEELKAKFPNVTLNVLGGYYIRFADPVVQAYAASKWGDGYGVTIERAEAVTEIPYNAFANNTEITSFDEIKLFKNIKIIGRSAFDGCVNLRLDAASLPISITSVGGYAFRKTKLFGKLNLPNLILFEYVNAFSDCDIEEIISLGHVTTLRGSEFASCKKLKNIPDLSNITNIGDHSFDRTICAEGVVNCPNLLSAVAKAFRGSAIKSIIDLGNVSFIDNEFFSGTLNLCYVIFPDSVTEIKAASTNSSLYSCKLPNNLIKFTGNAFKHALNLRRIRFPKTLTDIGGYMFGAWGKTKVLDYIIFDSTIPPTDNGMSLHTTSVGTIYVPDEYVEAYKTATYWINYADKIRPISEHTTDYNIFPESCHVHRNYILLCTDCDGSTCDSIWEIVEGLEYCTIDEYGLLTFNEQTPKNTLVKVRATSKDYPSLTDEQIYMYSGKVNTSVMRSHPIRVSCDWDSNKIINNVNSYNYDTFLIYVKEGERYRIKGKCASDGILVTACRSGDTFNTTEAESMPLVPNSKTNATDKGYDEEFVIPEKYGCIVVSTLNSTNTAYNPNYELSLTKLS